MDTTATTPTGTEVPCEARLPSALKALVDGLEVARSASTPSPSRQTPSNDHAVFPIYPRLNTNAPVITASPAKTARPSNPARADLRDSASTFGM